MEQKHFAFLALAAVAAVLYALDRRTHRKAKNVRTSWNCLRCGVLLGPMESEAIRVAGGEFATSARACAACAKRDRRIWWSTMGVILFALVATAFLTLAR
jgi:hypothetical protein